MNSLTADMLNLQNELVAYSNKPTKVQATKLRKCLTVIKNSSSTARKEILNEVKSRSKKVKVEEPRHEEVVVPKVEEVVFHKVEEVHVVPKIEIPEVLDPMTTSVVLKKERTKKSKVKKN